jgi:hypothetical protein
MLTHYLESLTEAIRRHDSIRKNAQLKSRKWTKSCYDIAADIIASRLDQILSAEEKIRMGHTISPKTLYNMFKGTYRLSYPIDPRTINTLTKLVRFTGYSSWEDFAEQTDNLTSMQAGSDDPAVAAAHALREAAEAEFRAYVALPETKPEQLIRYFAEGSPAFNRIMDLSLQYIAQGWCISNPYNPSTHEVLESECLSADEKQARFRTREYRLLCWWSAETARYIRRHKEISEHFYTLVNTPDGWRVRNNATLSDPAMDEIASETAMPQHPEAATPTQGRKKKSKQQAVEQAPE